MEAHEHELVAHAIALDHGAASHALAVEAAALRELHRRMVPAEDPGLDPPHVERGEGPSHEQLHGT